MTREQIEELFYGKRNEERRFTQDFPVLPDVWMEYGEHPNERLELLLTPHTRCDAATLAQALRERLKHEREVIVDDQVCWRQEHADLKDTPRILFNESVVLARFSLWELLRVAMPLSDWWRRVVSKIPGDWNYQAVVEFAGRVDRWEPGSGAFEAGDPKLLKKLIGIVGSIECDRKGIAHPEALSGPGLTRAEVEAFARLFDGLSNPQESRGLLWSVSRNREAGTSVWRSALTVKADAARRLFEVDTTGIRWAVLDTGIDARHRAFACRGKEATSGPGEPDQTPGAFTSRVIKTYDFLKIKDLLDPEIPVGALGTAAERMDAEELEGLRADLERALARGRAIDWNLLEPFLRIPHIEGQYRPPTDPHGTHVAGILAADWPEACADAGLEKPLTGLCPQLELYDIRVLGKGADEFTVMAALQFVRHLNAHKDVMTIHGVNLSMSVPHDVANFACGRTPVCEECERVVAGGVVVVTAAGNRGFNKLRQPEAGATGDYRYISLTDPGNADSVITVGATHRHMPHSYGVSYFSSRGPTGDGRTKPDLVAPGERIDSCSLNGDYETMDGTSMAAPHVSGVAALLMARHRELIGQPKRIKEILCSTATDLGRERRFQGHGMVDALRALQAV
jgi:subtilisin family serine protease